MKSQAWRSAWERAGSSGTGLPQARRVQGWPRREVPKRAPFYLKAEEVAPVLAQVPPEWRCLFATAVYSGMRRGELVQLTPASVRATPT
ncbi:hypothetical protein HNV27_22975 [Myxococcus xanthus]|nr:hypothetical protein [Myxococcus xanthus]